MDLASREGKGKRSDADEVRRGRLRRRGSPISVRSVGWAIACESELGHSPSCERRRSMHSGKCTRQTKVRDADPVSKALDVKGRKDGGATAAW